MFSSLFIVHYSLFTILKPITLSSYHPFLHCSLFTRERLSSRGSWRPWDPVLFHYSLFISLYPLGDWDTGLLGFCVASLYTSHFRLHTCFCTCSLSLSTLHFTLSLRLFIVLIHFTLHTSDFTLAASSAELANWHQYCHNI